MLVYVWVVTSAGRVLDKFGVNCYHMQQADRHGPTLPCANCLKPALPLPCRRCASVVGCAVLCCCRRVVSRQDADLIRTKGLAVVYCSWNRLDDVPFGEPAAATAVGRVHEAAVA